MDVDFRTIRACFRIFEKAMLNNTTLIPRVVFNRITLSILTFPSDPYYNFIVLLTHTDSANGSMFNPY